MSKVLIKTLVFSALLIGVVGVPAASASEASASIGTKAPAFTLSTYDGKEVSLEELKGEIVVLEWFNPGCPFVVNQYKRGSMQKLQKEMKAKGVRWISVNSTNPDHKDFLSKEKLAEISKEWGIEDVEFVKDSDGTVGKLYGAKTTPHMFVINKKGELVYNGAIDSKDDFYHDPVEADNYVEKVVSELIEGKAVSTSKTSPYGCSVKYAKS